ncbi:MAG: phytanoyl-CoA dioxygenase [Rhodospirillum sp.]|nr:phytanoyl-CoA dioxygenase [Rhodospirillum sp.]
MTRGFVTAEQVQAFHKDGAVVVPGLFADRVEAIRAGIERSMREPGLYASDYQRPGGVGRFFNDFHCWARIPEFFELVRTSPAAAAAAALMRSRTSQLFHDHILVKEPGTAMSTPWHQDAAYFFVEGEQTVNIWVPLDPVDVATLRFVAGSHLWPKLVQPVRWQSEEILYPGNDDYIPMPNVDAEPERYRVLEWPMQPGDAVAFHFRTLHSARGHPAKVRRRAFAVRFVGDDARYGVRSGVTVPPFPDHRMKPGQRLREDWFPVMWNGRWTFATDAEAAGLKTVAAEVTKRLNMPPAANGEAGRASPASVADRKSARTRPRGAAGLWSKIRKMQRKFSRAR